MTALILIGLGLGLAAPSGAQTATAVDIRPAINEQPAVTETRMTKAAICSWQTNYIAALAYGDKASFGIRREEFQQLWDAATAGCLNSSEQAIAIDIQVFSNQLQTERTRAVLSCFKQASASRYEAFKDRLWRASELEAKSFQFGVAQDFAPPELLACDPSLARVGPVYSDRRWAVMSFFWTLPGSPIKASDGHDSKDNQ